MPENFGSQFADHPNVIAGSALLPRLLADFVAYEFAVQWRQRFSPLSPRAAATV
jgi:hypothetical protein